MAMCHCQHIELVDQGSVLIQCKRYLETIANSTSTSNLAKLTRLYVTGPASQMKSLELFHAAEKEHALLNRKNSLVVWNQLYPSLTCRTLLVACGCSATFFVFLACLNSSRCFARCASCTARNKVWQERTRKASHAYRKCRRKVSKLLSPSTWHGACTHLTLWLSQVQYVNT